MDCESLAATYSSQALSLWNKKKRGLGLFGVAHNRWRGAVPWGMGLAQLHQPQGVCGYVVSWAPRAAVSSPCWHVTP